MWRYRAVVIREAQSRTSHMIPRAGARLLAGGGGPVTGWSRAQSRRQHTEAAAPVEVDVKRLEGTDDGRDAFCVTQHRLRF